MPMSTYSIQDTSSSFAPHERLNLHRGDRGGATSRPRPLHSAVDLDLRQVQELATGNGYPHEANRRRMLDLAQEGLAAAVATEIAVSRGLEQEMPIFAGQRAFDDQRCGAPLNQERRFAVEDPDESEPGRVPKSTLHHGFISSPVWEA